MLIRINQIENVNTYTNFNAATGGLGGHVRPQDIFVINTRFEKSIPGQLDTDRGHAARRLPLQPDHRPERPELEPAWPRLRVRADRPPGGLRA